MNNDKLISHIEELGLSNKEARVYVACLKLGPSPVQRIADQSGIKRVTTYVILESLVGLGMVSQSIKGKKTYFVAEEPTNLKRLLDKREHELKEQKHSFEQILPQLLGLKTEPKEMPEVKFYDGIDSVRSLFDSFYTSYKGPASHIYAFSNLDQIHEFVPDLSSGEPNPKRINANIRSHMIYTSKRGPVYSKTDSKANRESRYVPFDKYPMSGDIGILGEYIIFTSLVEDRPTAVTIRNQDMANAMKTIFDMVWEKAEEFNQ